MKLSEMLTAIREYPALKIKYEAMREQQASQERTAVQLSIAYNNLQIGNRKLSQKNKALETALVKLVPRLNSREHCRRFYKTVAPYLDPGGFVLYKSAAELTRFHISTEFARKGCKIAASGDFETITFAEEPERQPGFLLKATEVEFLSPRKELDDAAELPAAA